MKNYQRWRNGSDWVGIIIGLIFLIVVILGVLENNGIINILKDVSY